MVECNSQMFVMLSLQLSIGYHSQLVCVCVCVCVCVRMHAHTCALKLDPCMFHLVLEPECLPA